MKVVISLGGSIIGGENEIKKVADVLRNLEAEKIYVVCGGGSLARQYISMARNLGADEAFCDLIGIEASRMNARLLIAAIPEAHRSVPRNYEEAANAAERIVIMGGVSPGHTTDAVAAILAEYVGADLFINATSVDGVYTADPRKYRNARKLKRVKAAQLVEIVSKQEMKAGAANVLDLLAAKIIERSRIRAVVIDGRDPSNIRRVLEGKHDGTEIVHT